MDRRALLLGGLSLSAVLSAQAQPSPTAPAVSETPSAWLTRNLEAIRARHRVPALAGAIVMNGRIAAEAATGFRKEGAGARVQVTDAFQLGSITKPMTATLTAIFVEKGMLRWDLTMESAFPELLGLMNSAYRKVTITQLLSSCQRDALHAAHGAARHVRFGSEHASRAVRRGEDPLEG